MRRLFFFLTIAVFGLSPLLAAQEGMIVRLAKVYPQANSSTKSIGYITAGTRVELFGRKGGWKKVFSKKNSITGWVRGYQVREGNYVKPETTIETEADDRGFLSGLASFSRKASSFFGGGKEAQGSSSVATIGVRGLSEEQIKNAKPDLRQLGKMQGFGSSQSRMAGFVSAGHLSATKIKHLKN